MIRMIALCAALAAGALPSHTAAQEPAPPAAEVRSERMPAAVAAEVRDLFNHPETARHDGHTHIREGEVARRDVAVTGGPLVVAGRVEGDVAVLNGDLELRPGAEITGRATVVGGTVSGLDDARVGGGVAVYSEGVSYRRFADGIAWMDDEAPAAGRGEYVERPGRRPARPRNERGFAQLAVSSGDAYNRVEGLPIHVGPVIQSPGANPLRLSATAIVRQEVDAAYGPPRVGYDVRLEQFMADRRVRLGASVFSVVDPIEGWHVSDLETSLSTFVFHRDLRDHYERQGWSVFAQLAQRDAPFGGRVELRRAAHRAVAPGTPWSIFNNTEPWRLQPLIAEGDQTSLLGTATWDSRDDRREPTSGWYARASVEHAFQVDLARPQALVLDPLTGTEHLLERVEYGPYTHGLVDLRRYNRFGPGAGMHFRLVAGGALGGSPLPAQRQHALGGEGTLPGFSLFSLDCGARSTRASVAAPTTADPDARRDFYAAYGCDRFALAQAEYRGHLRFRFHVPASWYEDEVDLRRSDWNGRVDGAFTWVLFADAGHAWPAAGPWVEETAVDVGAGLMLGRGGIYAAYPLTGDGGLRFFLRLQPRF